MLRAGSRTASLDLEWSSLIPSLGETGLQIKPLGVMPPTGALQELSRELLLNNGGKALGRRQKID
jgi:hypothetical protein